MVEWFVNSSKTYRNWMQKREKGLQKHHMTCGKYSSLQVDVVIELKNVVDYVE
jgi:hypothetical protein